VFLSRTTNIGAVMDDGHAWLRGRVNWFASVRVGVGEGIASGVQVGGQAVGRDIPSGIASVPMSNREHHYRWERHAA
jgi:hypothetical protein